MGALAENWDPHGDPKIRQRAAALTCDSGIPEGSTAVMQRGWGGRGVTSAISSPDDAFHVNSSLLQEGMIAGV